MLDAPNFNTTKNSGLTHPNLVVLNRLINTVALAR